MSQWRLLVVLLVLSLVSCGRDRGNSSDSTIQLSDQDRQVASPTSVYSLGSADGPAWSSFQHIAHVAFDEENNLYVLDQGARKIFVFGERGDYLREIGRPGQGPGELTFPVRLAVSREGMLIVSDLRQRGFILFERDGMHRRTLPFPFQRAIGGLELKPHPDGGFVSESQPLWGARGEDAKIRLTWHTLEDSPARVLAAVEWDPDQIASAATGPHETAFLPRFVWGVLPSGDAAIVHTDRYRVDIVGSGRVSGIERAIEPRRVTARDRQRERKQRLADLTEHGASIPASIRQAALKEVDNLRFPRVLPVIDDLTADRMGRIWIRRKDRRTRAGRIDLLSREGTYLGTFPGERLPVAFSRSGLAAYVEEDSLGVQKVVVRRIPDDWDEK